MKKTYIYLLRMAIYAIAMLNNQRVTRFSYGYESIVEWTSIYQLFWCPPGVQGNLTHSNMFFCSCSYGMGVPEYFWGYPHSWMVYFMENPIYKWMITKRGIHHFRIPPYLTKNCLHSMVKPEGGATAWPAGLCHLVSPRLAIELRWGCSWGYSWL